MEIALNYLKGHNRFYSNVLINLENINQDLLCLSDIESVVEKGEFEIVVENENDEHIEGNNPLDLERTNAIQMNTLIHTNHLIKKVLYLIFWMH